jgi:hypothetical protein
MSDNTLAGTELMTLSESVLASFAPHLQLMLNPLAEVAPEVSHDEQSEASQLVQEVVGGEATASELSASIAHDATDSSQAAQ